LLSPPAVSFAAGLELMQPMKLRAARARAQRRHNVSFRSSTPKRHTFSMTNAA
jgi:hypothetical protein